MDMAISVFAWVGMRSSHERRTRWRTPNCWSLGWKNPAEDRPARCVGVHGLSPRVVSLTEDLDHDGLSRAVEVVDARDLEHRPACHHAAVQCARRGRSPRPPARAHERQAGRRPTSAPSSRDAERVTRRVGVGGRDRRPATASARSVSLAHHPVEVPAVGGCHSSCSPTSSKVRPDPATSYGLRDEDLRRAGQDSCRGTPSKGEERGRTRLERVLAPGVRSGPC